MSNSETVINKKYIYKKDIVILNQIWYIISCP
jgi:hypothetical protein